MRHPSPRLAAVAPVLLLAAALPLHAAAPAEPERTELERTPIVGNRELPKVLHIVPWKKPATPDPSGRPPGSVLDEPPAAIDRDVLRRQLRLERQLARRDDVASPAAAAASPNTTPTHPTSPGARP